MTRCTIYPAADEQFQDDIFHRRAPPRPASASYCLNRFYTKLVTEKIHFRFMKAQLNEGGAIRHLLSPGFEKHGWFQIDIHQDVLEQ